MCKDLNTSVLQRDARVFFMCARILGFKNLAVLDHGHLGNH